MSSCILTPVISSQDTDSELAKTLGAIVPLAATAIEFLGTAIVKSWLFGVADVQGAYESASAASAEREHEASITFLTNEFCFF